MPTTEISMSCDLRVGEPRRRRRRRPSAERAAARPPAAGRAPIASSPSRPEAAPSSRRPARCRSSTASPSRGRARRTARSPASDQHERERRGEAGVDRRDRPRPSAGCAGSPPRSCRSAAPSSRPAPACPISKPPRFSGARMAKAVTSTIEPAHPADERAPEVQRLGDQLRPVEERRAGRGQARQHLEVAAAEPDRRHQRDQRRRQHQRQQQVGEQQRQQVIARRHPRHPVHRREPEDDRDRARRRSPW